MSRLSPDHSKRSKTTLRLIAAFKVFKGLLLLAVAIGALSLLHKNLHQIALLWIDELRIDPNNRHVAAGLAKIGLVTAPKLEALSGLTGFYSILLLTEGAGLFWEKRWAEYLTVVSTALLIPLEIYEISVHRSWPRIGILTLNVAIVWYLIARLRAKK